LRNSFPRHCPNIKSAIGDESSLSEALEGFDEMLFGRGNRRDAIPKCG
jgi:hypothetical protein